MKPPQFQLLSQQLIQLGLEEEQAAGRNSGCLFAIIVGPDDIPPQLGKSQRRGQTDMAQPKDADFHGLQSLQSIHGLLTGTNPLTLTLSPLKGARGIRKRNKTNTKRGNRPEQQAVRRDVKLETVKDRNQKCHNGAESSQHQGETGISDV